MLNFKTRIFSCFLRSLKIRFIVFICHEVHHAQPRLKTRLMMLPVASIPLRTIFLILSYLTSPNWWNNLSGLG